VSKKSFRDMTSRIMPDQKMLDAMTRDLSFVPSSATNAISLTKDQIGQFNRNGFLMPLDRSDIKETESLREYFDNLLARVQAAGADSYSIISGQVKHARIYDIAKDERILRYVRDLIGNDIVCWGAHFFCKMPGDGKAVSWHQDASYWPLTPSKTVTCWLAIDRSDRENACMRFIPGSHSEGHINYRASEPSEDNVLNQTVDNAERFGEPVDVILDAGQFSLHSDLLLHGSGKNSSSRRRGGLTLRYAATEVRSLLNWNNEGVVVSGVDANNHWGNPPRPEND
jgi:non-heme Fe2+,alpha-ketoglutarate-dependent halogenase|tara:strand:+ start:52 stop:900 length:849 start_codon:yes stop_codon:yes gene_type:complete